MNYSLFPRLWQIYFATDYGEKRPISGHICTFSYRKTNASGVYVLGGLMRSFFLFLSASQHSGTVEDEHDEGDDEDALARCYICDQPFTDVDR